jgi:hypothetical protein
MESGRRALLVLQDHPESLEEPPKLREESRPPTCSGILAERYPAS